MAYFLESAIGFETNIFLASTSIGLNPCSIFDNLESAPISRFLASKTQRPEVSQKNYYCFSTLCASLCLCAFAAILYFLLFGVVSKFKTLCLHREIKKTAKAL